MVRKTDIAGKLRHSIIIQNTTETTVWGTFANVRASITPLNGREYFESKQINSEEVTRFTIRYIKDITTKMRILWGTRIYDIRSIINLTETDKLMVLMVVEDV